MVNKGIAQVLSSMFHPLLMPSYLFFIIITLHPQLVGPLSDEGRNYLMWMIFFSTFLFPLFSVFIFSGFFRRRLKMSHLIMDNREERIIPFLFTGLVYLGVTYLMLHTLKLNAIIVMLMAGITLTVIIVSFITLFWKISAHAAGIFGVIALLFFLNQKFAEGQFYHIILGFILAAGIVCSARLYLNSHNPLQVMAGSLLGILTAMFSFYILI